MVPVETSGNGANHRVQGIPEHVIAKCMALFDSASSSEDVVQLYHHQCGRLLWVPRTENATDVSPDPQYISDNAGKGVSMLAVKPRQLAATMSSVLSLRRARPWSA